MQAGADAAVLVVTPSPADAALACGFLAEAGIPARHCPDLRGLAEALPQGVGCAVLVAEALDEAELSGLREALERLPPWRDVPLVVVGEQLGAVSEVVARELPEAANVTLLGRPLSPATLVSAARAGLRATRRQLEVGALVAEREQALRARDEFLAMLAHELRNPLAPMRNAVYLQRTLAHADPLFEKTREILDRQTHHIARMVDDLVDVARLEKGKMTLKKTRVELNMLVGSAIEAAAPLVQARGHRVEAELSADPLVIDADATRIEQIVCNLVTNAAKFTPQPDVIRVLTRAQGGMAVAAVHDRGAGFAPADGEALFGMFVQASQPLSRPHSGLGIGLTIARRLAELHGGSVSAWSAGRGEGAVFTVCLPLALGRMERAAPARESGSGPRKRVLVVEDSQDIRETMRILLSQWGHEVALAASGEDGLAEIERARPDVAIIDIGLPGINGYELARRIRAMPSSGGMRLIALTGYGQPSDSVRALQSGFDQHLLKPLAPETLRATLGA